MYVRLASSISPHTNQHIQLQDGILGLGFDTLEDGFLKGSPVYSSFIDKLLSEKLINTPLFSLSLKDVDERTGSLTFGGIDTDKFVGELLSTPMVPSPSTHRPNNTVIDEFFVDLVHFGINGEQDTLLEIPALLDSGTSFTYLPLAVVEPLAETLGGQWNDKHSLYEISCNHSHRADDYFGFGFGSGFQSDNESESRSPIIRVPFSNMIVAWNRKCWLGLAPHPFNYSILGDTFLRSAYAVFDLKNGEIGLAQAYTSSGESVVEIDANATTIPWLCGRNSTLCSSTDVADSSEDDSEDDSEDVGPEDDPEDDSGKDSENLRALYAWLTIKLLVFGMLIAIVAYYCSSEISRRRYESVSSKDEDGDVDQEESV